MIASLADRLEALEQEIEQVSNVLGTVSENVKVLNDSLNTLAEEATTKKSQTSKSLYTSPRQ